jgi:hypothetical protein
MNFADFAFVQAVQGTTIKSDKKEFCKKRASLLAARPDRRKIDKFSYKLVTGGTQSLPNLASLKLKFNFGQDPS